MKPNIMQDNAIFLDRDGVLNRERGTYTYQLEDFEILPQVVEALELLKNKSFKLIIITNQGGINKGLYTSKDVLTCFDFLQRQSGNLIDGHYYSPYHSNFTNSLSRKPNSLMLEKAIAKYQINTKNSWMIGDSERDIIAGESQSLQTILITSSENKETSANYIAKSLYEATKIILDKK